MSCNNGTGCIVCDDGVIERPRYFPRQLVTADDLSLDQRYFRDRLRRHNRYLHGWGVVCGALVCPVTDKNNELVPWKVQIRPGYVLGPMGDEILIDCTRQVDLRTRGVACAGGEPAGEHVDPWCTPVFVPRQPEKPLCVAVRYCEFSTRPVRVQPVGCGCDESACEPSRWRDGYEVGFLDHCPPSHKSMPGNLSLNVQLTQAQGQGLMPQCIPDCPPCPVDDGEGWVVLGCVTFDANGQVTRIDNCCCRRMVLSHAHTWWECSCGEPGGAVTIRTDPPVIERSTRVITVFAEGTGFQTTGKPEVYLGEGLTVQMNTVKVEEASPAGTIRLTFTVNIDPNAGAGPRNLVVTNPDCSVVVKPGAITIPSEPKSKPSPAPGGLS